MITVRKIVSRDEMVNVFEPLVFEHNSMGNIFLKLFVEESYVILAIGRREVGDLFSFSFEVRSIETLQTIQSFQAEGQDFLKLFHRFDYSNGRLIFTTQEDDSRFNCR